MIRWVASNQIKKINSQNGFQPSGSAGAALRVELHLQEQYVECQYQYCVVGLDRDGSDRNIFLGPGANFLCATLRKNVSTYYAHRTEPRRRKGEWIVIEGNLPFQLFCVLHV
mmetsp:Transcript_21831/g.62623  ORF Transcript_21831/g.62623 Transcript_21831/m.62623 type:complete len:112 (+) Transcript_21831:805-1140(+)